MNIRELLNKRRIYFDGGMGTLLQQRGLTAGEKPEMWSITHPEVLTEIHLQYLNAGSNVISANTFGANCLKFTNLEQIISSALNNARRAVELFEGDKSDCFIAFDMGPTGKLLEPAGDLPFSKAVDIFAENVRLAEKYGADLIIIETMNDSYETKAAVLAAKENSDLPIFVTNVFDEKGKLMTGADSKAMIAMLEGLGVDAIGMNCSLGPRQMLPRVKEYVEYSSLPVIVNPNAGLPRSENGATVFDINADEYAEIMREIALLGASVLGGCCGTTPEYIKKTVEKTKDLPFVPAVKKDYTFVSSYTHAVEIGNEPILIGERINPTGKKRFKQALRERDIQYILSEGIAQQERGVHILDVNVGLPEIDEEEILTASVKAVQEVIDLPLQIDTVKVSAMEKAMRIYNGKPMINSVNGKKESMDAVLPLVKKYGGVVVALTIDENGIPETAEGRCAVAEKIIKECEKYGIDRKDIIVDPLAMAVSSDERSGRVTLDSVELIRKRLGVKTGLGVSNISFGLPARASVNALFLAMAFERGLNCAIMNPDSAEMMQSYYTYRALKGYDEGCLDYIGFASDVTVNTAKNTSGQKTQGSTDTLYYCIVKGLREKAYEKALELLKAEKPLEIIDSHIIPALDAVGKQFEEKTLYLPQLLMSAEAAGKAFEAVKTAINTEGTASKGEILVATVKGDIHDIGKNILKVLLENYGYKVTDLGKDVPAEVIVKVAKENNIRLIGLSALMTTTVEAMKETIELLRREFPEAKVMVGGAVLTKEYADMIGADFYAKDAMGGVRIAEELFSAKK
ncbi:MAG: homocysteine S-methyltransferase family protein [Clostridia bacterium]|nr:homocysteine S-methyltransferase family protein [Clostridia bacterium]